MNSFNEQVIFHAADNKSTDEVHDTSIFSCLLIQYVDHCVVITVEVMHVFCKRGPQVSIARTMGNNSFQVIPLES